MVCGPACGPDQIAIEGGSCRCLRIGATLDPATGTCGCPAGQVDISQPGEAGMKCVAACPAGQRYNQTPDGKMVCGPACGPDQIATAGGACRCVGEGLVVDPATGLCLNPCSEGQQLNADGFCDTIKRL
jgi:hypothetical protein